MQDFAKGISSLSFTPMFIIMYALPGHKLIFINVIFINAEMQPSSCQLQPYGETDNDYGSLENRPSF